MSIEHYPDSSIPAHLLDWVWEASPMLSALAKYRIPGAAILRGGGGTELLLAERPWDGQYLIGTLLPSPDYLNVTGAGPHTVDAITVRGAAADVGSRLLPEFERLVHLARLREVQEDLDWVHGFEPGAVDAVELDGALDRFLTHAPHLLAATRRPGGNPLAASESAVLMRFEILLARAESGAGARDGSEPGGMDEAMALWLEDGKDLLDVIRTVTAAPAEESSRRAVSAAAPPQLPVAVTVGRTR